MSSSALFGNNVSRNATKNLVEFKAGKMTMKGKMVYPDTRKGQLYVYQSDDSLMHFCWKDRTTGIVEDDLIIFPDDCEFKHVSQCKSGRVYLLKFKSSSRKFFFWLQDFKTEKDEEYCKKINEVLNNPPSPGSQRINGGNPEGDLQNLLNNMSQQQLMQLFGGVGQIGSLGSLLGNMNRPFSINRTFPSSLNAVATTATRSASSSTSNSSSITHEPSKTTGNNKPTQSTKPEATNDDRIRLSDLQNFLSGLPTPTTAELAIQREIANELNIAIPALISSNDELEHAMEMYLPAGDNLSITLSSPQFSQALSLFWSAFQYGEVAPLIQQFGLGSEAINAATNGNIEQFVYALETEMKNHSDFVETICSSRNIKDTSSPSIEQKNEHQNTDNQDEKKSDDEGMNFD